MRKIFCVIAAVFVLLPLAAQDFNPAAGPLEGVWKSEDEDEAEVIIFVGNLILVKDDWDDSYEVLPGMIYKNGEALGPVVETDFGGYEDYETLFSYKLSGNTLKIIAEDDDEESYVKAPDDILRNKSRLEGIWAFSYQNPYNSEEAGELLWIFTGGLIIAAMKTDSSFQYAEAIEFTSTDATITAMDDTISYTLSGNELTLTDGDETLVFTRRR
ncbi:MAG: hypothetical protein LBQ67_03350 [Treponema sp.]|jgi:hypothetical protein|nr:hypothetical protein [Treponema sp.]